MIYRAAQDAALGRRVALIRKGQLTKAERIELSDLDAYVADLPTGNSEQDKISAILKRAYFLTLERAKTAKAAR